MKKILALIGFIVPNLVFAGSVPVNFTYQGKLMNAAGTAPLSATIGLKLDILDPSGKCLIYSETQSNIDLSQNNGLFAVLVGSTTGDAKRTAGEPGLSMSQVFANAGNQLVASGGTCTSGYTPASGDGRLLHVSVINGGSTTIITPDLPINSVPNALVSETLQGYSLSQVLPAGMTISYSGFTCPTGFLPADGSSYSTTQYPNLFSALNYNYGGSGSSFSLPDYRGVFLRGADNLGGPNGARGLDPEVSSRTGGGPNKIGSYQADQFKSHNHQQQGSNRLDFGAGGGVHGDDVDNQSYGSIFTLNNGGTETRPKNVYINYCIKY